MASNHASFPWDGTSRKAAKYTALGRYSYRQIAQKIGSSKRTVARWNSHPVFAAEVDRLIDLYRARVRRQGLGILERRVEALNDRWVGMKRVIAERARAKELQNVPGGKTGLICHDVKSIGSGETAQVVDVYEVDTGLLKELREHEKQAAQELGQWVDQSRVEQTLKGYVTESPDTLCHPPDSHHPSEPTSLTEPPEPSGETSETKS